MKKSIILSLVVLGLFLAGANVGFAQVPGTGCTNVFCTYFQTTAGTGRVYFATDALGIVESIGGFLIVVGGILSGIVIVVAGILYMTAGSNQTRVGTAKAVFKNGLIGALILFAAGVIMSTIATFASDPTFFFN